MSKAITGLVQSQDQPVQTNVVSFVFIIAIVERRENCNNMFSLSLSSLLLIILTLCKTPLKLINFGLPSSGREAGGEFLQIEIGRENDRN